MGRYSILIFMAWSVLLSAGGGGFAVAQQKLVRDPPHSRPVENSLIRPPVRKNAIPERIYRQNKAREALKSGDIVAFSVIRHRVRQAFPGRIVDVRLIEPRRPGLSYIYLVKLLRPGGRILMLKIDAATANIISVKGNG